MEIVVVGLSVLGSALLMVLIHLSFGSLLTYKVDTIIL